MGLEPTTATLARWRSTTELRSLLSQRTRGKIAQGGGTASKKRGVDKKKTAWQSAGMAKRNKEAAGREAARGGRSRGAGLYVHVPFCAKKCPYCAFFSRGGAGRGAVREWMAGLEREIAAFLRRKDAAEFRPATVFFGGGTPTWLEAGELAALAGLLRRRFDLSGVEEWSCEANPGTVTAEKFAALRAAGVNRISLGVQSFEDATLRRLERIHGGEEAAAAVAAARAAGFAHVGVDLIYGVPGDDEERVERDMAAAEACGADHLSCYCLEFEEGTPFWRKRPRGEAARALAERQWREYGAIRRLARAGGWRQYELSNFARNGAVCAHNLLYWSGGDYLGLGPGAHSHWRGERWGNTRGTAAWRRAFSERLAPDAAARETLVMGLRRTAGWKLAAFREATGFDAMELRGEEIRRAVAAGHLVRGKDRLRLAARALFASDAVFSDLV